MKAKYALMLKNNKKIIAVVLAMSVFILTAYIFMSNNYWVYDRTVVKIIDCKTESQGVVEGTNGKNEKNYIQSITATIKNGEYKGQTIVLSNTYSYSSVKTNQYRKGNELFVDLKNEDGLLSAKITGEKRDKYLVLLFAVFLFVMMLFSGKRGFATLVSLIINTAVFGIMVTLFGSAVFSGWIWIVLLLLFTIITIMFAVGFKKKSLGAIISSLCTVILISALYLVSVYGSTALPYELMEYTVAFLPLRKIYLISVIFGSLGAITDVSVTINSCVYELINVTDDSINLRKLKKSVRTVSYDILGTMINVMFFAYISGSIPIIALRLTNGIGLNIIYKSDLVFEAIRFLIGSIGIVAAIPISATIAVLLYRKELRAI